MTLGRASMVSLSLLALLSGAGTEHDGVEIPEIPIHPVILAVARRTLARDTKAAR
jgi:hypothetical protein